MWYDSFLELLRKENHVCEYDSYFYKYLVEHGNNVTAVVEYVVPFYERLLKKPQRLWHDDVNYYIAEDMWTHTMYICYKRLIMIDIDYKGASIDAREEIRNNSLDKLRAYVNANPSECFRVYSSPGGLHVFLLSRESTEESKAGDIRLMWDMGGDRFYVVFSSIRGWCVRLNRKTHEQELEYTWICDIGDTGKIVSELEKECNLHINLVKIFRNNTPSLMA